MQKRSYISYVGRAVLLAAVLLGAPAVRAQETLHLYGPTGTCPAIEEAAVAFAAYNNVKLEVTTAPLSEWTKQTQNDADLVYCSGDFILSDLLHGSKITVDEQSVTRLYVRPSAILVRPTNPKDIRDFPDLLRPGIKVMIVNGSGQSGLWENMTGRLQSLQNLVALQKNIAICAPDADQAMKLWRESDEIDAWVVWNVWHMPRRHSAKVIPISADYLIYREATIALTPRGTKNQTAAAFVRYLTSREGFDIFQSWGWAQAPANASPAIAERGVCVAARIKQNAWANSVGRGLERVHRLVEEYRALGIPARDIHVCALIDEDTAYWVLRDEAYESFTSTDEGNPNIDVVADLVNAGVSVEVSADTLRKHGWSKDDVLTGVNIVGKPDQRIAELGSKGYSYLPF